MTAPLAEPPTAARYRARDHAAASTTDYVFSQLIPYLGNKRKLLPLIGQAIGQTGVTGGLFVDFFAGSGVVSRFAKRAGFRVVANDWEPYAHILNQASIGCNMMPPFAALGGVHAAFAALNAAPPVEGYVAAHLCPRSDAHPDPDTERLFFTRANGRKIDALRETIQDWQEAGRLTEGERAVLLASLLYAVSYVSNTSGVFKGFHRGWGGATQTALYRILSEIALRPPVLHDNGRENGAHRQDAQALASSLRADGIEADIAYLDPPYNQHPYGSNYHVLNTVALWDRPDIAPYTDGRNKSAIRRDWRTERRSAYNHATALAAYQTLLQTIRAQHILTSYSTDGNMPLEGLLQAAVERGRLSCVTHSYKRYRVSSQRMSARPRNVEFVLSIDTARRSTAGEAERMGEMIRAQEAAPEMG
jgi:adenine-specific DNA-methyltransferase